MLYDLDRKKAMPGTSGVCPCCKNKVIAKCGRIKIWHWSHESLSDCDDWYEPISDWHLSWQDMVEEKYREVVVGNHRADIKDDTGRVFEIQNSPLSIEDMEEREDYYNNMVWIFNGSKFYDSIDFCERLSEKTRENYVTWKWRRPRKYIIECTKPVLMDFEGIMIDSCRQLREDLVLEVGSFKNYNDGVKKYGYGRFIPKTLVKNFLFRRIKNV
jgi:competence protein CoiA